MELLLFYCMIGLIVVLFIMFISFKLISGHELKVLNSGYCTLCKKEIKKMRSNLKKVQKYELKKEKDRLKRNKRKK